MDEAGASAMPVLVLMGVASSGKTTIGRALADLLGWRFVDADDLHPAANIAAMSAGRPLTDVDRAPWLALVADVIAQARAERRPTVIACSALARRYRDVLRGDGVVFVHLVVDSELVAQRAAARTGHFMPAALVGSQYDALESPGPDENAIAVDARATPDTVVAVIVDRLGPRPAAS